MKKYFSIILSFILVVCMIPANALIAYGATKITVNDKECDVQISGNEVYYNDAVQVPEVTLYYNDENGSTITLSNNDGYSVSYEKAGVAVTPRAAGTYDIMITPVGGRKVDVGDFVIKPLTKEQLEVKALDGDISLSDLKEDMSNQFGLFFGNNMITTGVSITAGQIPGKSAASVNLTVSGNESLPELSVIGLTFAATASLVKDYDISAVSDYTYTGKEIKPNITITKKSAYNGNEAIKGTLVEDEDYKVSYSNNINVGTAHIVITGKKNYSGEINMDFNITAKDISDLTVGEKTIDKGAKEPNLIIKYGDIILKSGTDYKYESVDSTTDKSVGSNINVTVEGMNNYAGSRLFNDIKVVDGSKNLAKSTLNVSESSFTYNGSAQYPTVKSVYLNGVSVGSSSYSVSYQKVDGTAIAASNIKDAGTYYIVITGKNGYAGVQTKKFNIEQLDINSSLVTATYIGSLSTNPVKLQLGSKVLDKGTDYEVVANTSLNYYTVTGKGNFKGTRKVYTSTRNLSYCTINFSDGRSTVSFGQTYYPKVTVTDYVNGKNVKLYEGTDYEVGYKNAKNQTVFYCKEPGTYSVIVTGKGAYTGTRTLYYTINGTDISNYTVTLKEASVKVTGTNQIPVISSVKYGSYSSLTSNDYTVSYQDSTGKTVTSMSLPGTYKVVVTGRNGYSGSTSTTFRIVGLTQTVTVDQESHKVYPTSAPFRIVAKATGDGTGFTYYSSNPAVASVSATGYVTMYKVGRAEITVMTTGMKKYDPASATVEVKVYPKKTTISKKPWTDGKKGQLKVRWGYQDGVTKYQVRYSRDKSFSSGLYLTKTVKAHGKDYTTQSTTLSNLKSGYTYYIKVRAVYTDPATGDNYYGSWSGWRSAKTL